MINFLDLKFSPWFTEGSLFYLNCDSCSTLECPNELTNWRIELNISKTPSSIDNLKKTDIKIQHQTEFDMAVLVDFSGTLRSWHLRVLLVVLIGYSS